MDMENVGNKEETREMSYFDRLDADVWMIILSKVGDLKSLCRCTLVSKQFTSGMYDHIGSVSVSLPGFDTDSFAPHPNMLKRFTDEIDLEEPDFGIISIIEPPYVQSKQLRFLSYLRNFTNLKSVHLEFACASDACAFPILKWKANLYSIDNRTRGEGLVTLLPTSISEGIEGTSESDEQEQESHNELMDFFKSPCGAKCSQFALTCSCEWFAILISLIKDQRSLERVTCTDSHNHGKLVFGQELLVQWRSRLLEQNMYDGIPRTISMGFIPELKLPVAGYRLKKVYMVFMDFGMEPWNRDDVGDEYEFDFMLSWNYEGEDMWLNEALREIRKNHLADLKLRLDNYE